MKGLPMSDAADSPSVVRKPYFIEAYFAEALDFNSSWATGYNTLKALLPYMADEQDRRLIQAALEDLDVEAAAYMDEFAAEGELAGVEAVCPRSTPSLLATQLLATEDPAVAPWAEGVAKTEHNTGDGSFLEELKRYGVSDTPIWE